MSLTTHEKDRRFFDRQPERTVRVRRAYGDEQAWIAGADLCKPEGRQRQFMFVVLFGGLITCMPFIGLPENVPDNLTEGETLRLLCDIYPNTRAWAQERLRQRTLAES